MTANLRAIVLFSFALVTCLWSDGDRLHAQSDEAYAAIYQPPVEYANQLGVYRSPLIFEDGTRVQSAAEWPRRRAEILRHWTDSMGAWPAVLSNPKFEVTEKSEREGIAQWHVRIQTSAEQEQMAWLLKPQGEGPFPAVLVVFYEPETSVGLKADRPLRDFAWQLSKRGFVTLSLGTPGGNAWEPDRSGALCQPLSYHAYVAANAFNALSKLEFVDRTRIGVTGHSYGGKWALFAAALWEPFAACAVSDPGIVFDETRSNVNYWEPWYLGFDPNITRPRGIPSAERPRTGAYRVLREQGRDLHEIHALLAPRPFLVSGGAEDPPERWVPLNHLRQINDLLGVSHRVAMTNRKTHDPTEESNAMLYRFFQDHLGNQRLPKIGKRNLPQVFTD